MSTRGRAGQRVGRWRLLEALGTGGFGTTWRGRDEDGREGAVKLLSAPPGDELRNLADVCHPAVPGVLDGGGGTQPFLVMELARGSSLTAWLRAGPAASEVVARVGAVLADALAAIHHAGVLHGDVKPDNIVVADLEQPVLHLVDFGLAGAGSGGTLQYAAPERLGGRSHTGAGDLYSLGLVLLEMLHGTGPWPELDLSQALVRRRQAVPEVTEGEPWLRELVGAMLALVPEERPAAAIVADTFEAHGARLPVPGPELIRRRSRSVHVERPTVAEAAEVWLRGEGTLALVGRSGTGRSHELGRVLREVRARGLPALRLVPVGRPWGAIEAALESEVLVGHGEGLAPEHEPILRASSMAATFGDRAPAHLAVIADDWACLDEGTLLTLAALADRGTVPLLVAGTEAPAWAAQVVELEPLDASGIASLARQLLGESGDLADLVEVLQERAGGLPADTVELMVKAVARGAVVRRAHRWLVDPGGLGELVMTEVGSPAEEPRLGPVARQVGLLVGLSGDPLPLADLSTLGGLEPAALDASLVELCERGLVVVERGTARARAPRDAAVLVRAGGEPTAAHLALARLLLDADPVPWERLGPHLVEGGDVELLRTHVVRCIEALHRREALSAARLAEAAWELVPGPELAVACIDSLVHAGRTEEALAFGRERLAGGQATLDTAMAVVRAALYGSGYPAQARELLAEAKELASGDVPALRVLEAKVHFRSGRHDEAIEAVEPLVRTAPPAGADELEDWLMAHLVHAQALGEQGQGAAAVSELDALPVELGRGTRTWALIDQELGRLLVRTGRVRRGAEILERAAAASQGMGLLDRGRLLNNAAVARYFAGERLQALALWEEALLAFDRLGNVLEQVRIRTNLCAAYREVARWERARQAGEWAFSKAGELGDVETRANAAANMAALQIWLGELLSADGWLDVAEEVARVEAMAGVQVEVARLRAERAALAASSDAVSLAEQARALAEEHGAELEGSRAEVLLLLGRVRAGARVDVVAALSDILDPLQKSGAAGDLAEVRLWLAEALVVAGHHREALAQVARVVVYAEEVGHVALRKRADLLTARAGADLEQGGDDRASRLQDLAVRVARERDLEGLLDAIARAALELLDGQRAFVMLLEGDELVVAASCAADDSDPGQPSTSVARRAIESGKEVIAADLGDRPDLRIAASVRELQLGSVMCVPLVDGDATHGAVMVDSRGRSEQELLQAVQLLRALAAHGAIAVSNARRWQASAARQRRAAEVAHDIRGPVGTVMILAEELREARRSEAFEEEALSAILTLSQQVIDLARDLLGRSSLCLVELDFGDLVERALGLLTHRARETGVVLEYRQAIGCRVSGDPVGLQRILDNLVSNACRYSPQGGCVEIALECDAAWARLSVRDHGEGLPEGLGDEIFETGFQGPDARQGHGLGLGIARRLAQAHGGRLTASDHAEGGALFVLELPRVSEGA